LLHPDVNKSSFFRESCQLAIRWGLDRA
jgi:hypothetical protein